MCGRVSDLQSESCGFKSQPGLLRTKVYSAFHPSGVGKWVPAAAGKAKAGMAHSDWRWTCGCAGKTVKSLENMSHTSALLRWWFTTKRRYIKCMHLLALPNSVICNRVVYSNSQYHHCLINNEQTVRMHELISHLPMCRPTARASRRLDRCRWDLIMSTQWRSGTERSRTDSRPWPWPSIGGCQSPTTVTANVVNVDLCKISLSRQVNGANTTAVITAVLK